jgi:sigma-B regulation protein RsbU (phosphoserine phosphatase)
VDRQGKTTHYVSVSKDTTEKRKRQEHDIELRMAAMVQKKLYPAMSPDVAGLDLAGSVYSAEATCGDYFDYISCADGGLAIAIGDVSGHGLGPALLMAETRAYLRPLLKSHAELDTAFNSLNQLISEDLESGRFVTLLVAKISEDLGTLCYSNAGHTPGYVLSENGALKLAMNPTGTALGILEDSAYTVRSGIVLQPGDLILFLTDGVTEARTPDGTFFGEERALELVRAHRHESAREIVEHLYQAVGVFTRSEDQTDDITILVAKVGDRSVAPGPGR